MTTLIVMALIKTDETRRFNEDIDELSFSLSFDDTEPRKATRGHSVGEMETRPQGSNERMIDRT